MATLIPTKYVELSPANLRRKMDFFKSKEMILANKWKVVSVFASIVS